MKRFFAVILALVLCFSVASFALADGPAGDQVHDGTLPYTSEQQVVKITISGLHVGGEDDDTRLPSEYHVRVKWNIADGVYNATATDGKDGFKNFDWDCVTLEYKLASAGSSTAPDVREGNWAAKPAVGFEVTNASTPDLKIYVTATLKSNNAWAGLLKAATLETQNTGIINREVKPVQIADMGTGVDSYDRKHVNSQNVYAYDYVLNWDYDALNTKALKLFKDSATGTTDASQDLENTFVVTISAGVDSGN